MPQFFFHVIDSAGTATDEDGLDLTDLAAARVVAVKGARDILAAEVRSVSYTHLTLPTKRIV